MVDLRHVIGLLLISAGIRIGGDRVTDRLLDDLLGRAHAAPEDATRTAREDTI